MKGKIVATIRGRWSHAKPPTPRHRADPHYSAAGKWVCMSCREPVKRR